MMPAMGDDVHVININGGHIVVCIPVNILPGILFDVLLNHCNSHIISDLTLL